MTATSKPGRAPGEGSLPAAPLLHVTRLAEIDSEFMGDPSRPGGNTKDEGTNWTLIARYVNGAEEFEFGVYSLGPDQYHPKHFHPAGAEFYYITEGSCRVTVGTEEVEATPGTAIYIPPNTVHAVRTRADEHMTMVYGFSCGDFRDAGTTWVE